jgi:hypothetical protein
MHYVLGPKDARSLLVENACSQKCPIFCDTNSANQSLTTTAYNTAVT